MKSGLSNISKEELRDLLTKGWLTHDAMWLYHCFQECGMETANRINSAAIQSMSAIEIQRIKKVLGLPKVYRVKAFDELVEVMDGAFALIKGDFMKFTFSATAKNFVHWQWENCFAYEGVSALGAIDQYQCGIMARVEGWLQGLGVPYTLKPTINGCLMHRHGQCAGDIVFNLN
jgi:hypothetical protein